MDRNRTNDAGEKAMHLMREHGIAPTPDNYAIWFNYADDAIPELTQELGAVIDGDPARVAELSAGFHDKYLSKAEEEEVIRETGDKLENEVRRVVELLDSVAEGSRDFGQSLNASMKKIAEDMSRNRLAEVIETLVGDVQTMAETNAGLQKQLEESGREVASLKANLNDVREQAMTDSLTGLPNRRQFEDHLSRCIVETSMNADPMCVVVADIDHFKKFNDTFGHQTGDRVLQLVGRVLMDSMSSKDFCARLGGEEFVVIMPETGMGRAISICEKIRKAVSGKKLRNRQTGQDMGKLTVSLGISKYRPGDTPDAMVERADVCLYRAKDAGRDRTVAEDDSDVVGAA